MILVTFISMHSVIMCVVLPWRTYEMHPALFLKSGCDIDPFGYQIPKQGVETKYLRIRLTATR